MPGAKGGGGALSSGQAERPEVSSHPVLIPTPQGRCPWHPGLAATGPTVLSDSSGVLHRWPREEGGEEGGRARQRSCWKARGGRPFCAHAHLPAPAPTGPTVRSSPRWPGPVCPTLTSTRPRQPLPHRWSHSPAAALAMPSHPPERMQAGPMTEELSGSPRSCQRRAGGEVIGIAGRRSRK